MLKATVDMTVLVSCCYNTVMTTLWGERETERGGGVAGRYRY